MLLIDYQITHLKNNIKMRYRITKEQLERVVENFVMETATAPTKDMIPAQAPEAKKYVKNKMSGDMVDQSENMPSVTNMKDKSQAPEAKKHIMNKMSGKMVEKSSNAPTTQTGMKKMSQAPEAKKNMNKGTSYMKEETVDEGLFGGGSEKLHMKDLNTKIRSWVAKGMMNQPSEEVMKKYAEDAKKDKYEGKPGIDEKTKELVYRPAKNIKWGSAAGHTFGGGAGM